MDNTNIWKEIAKIKNPRWKIYFQWKNGLQNLKTDYGALTEEEMIEMCNRTMSDHKINNPDYFLKRCKRWESSPEYKRLVCLLAEDNFASDILEVYEQVKKKALDGDSQAIKNMLLLQKEIKKYRQSIDEFFEIEEQAETEEDDGLII